MAPQWLPWCRSGAERIKHTHAVKDQMNGATGVSGEAAAVLEAKRAGRVPEATGERGRGVDAVIGVESGEPKVAEARVDLDGKQ